MRIIRNFSVGVLLVLLGTMAPAFAQHDRHEHGREGRPQKFDNNRAHGPKDHGRQQQAYARPQRPQREAYRPQPQQRDARAYRTYDQHYRPAQRGWDNDRENMWSRYRARSWESEHRDWRQRGGYHGYYVPADRFRVYFGPSHRFRVRSLPVIVVGGFPRFQYGGYWFAVVDPWPQYWANDWYDRDDMYIDYYGDGYYLCNRRYPGTRIAVNILID